MIVLSLFDGISCAKVALERAGIQHTYYASEIDKYAIQVSQANHPDIHRLGDVCKIQPFPVDLLIGGSPCQDLSIAKRDRKGLEGERSGLFWEQVRLWKDCKPKWFILENVASMPKAAKDLISETLGVQPVLIDAALVSAQSRKRLFWTNLPVVGLPEDKGIILNDILLPETEVDERLITKTKKAFCLDANYHKGGSRGTEHSAEKKNRTLVVAALEGGLRKGMESQAHLSRAQHQQSRVYSEEGKAPTLQASEVSGRTFVLSGRDIGRRLDDILLPETEVDERLITKTKKAFCLDANYHKGGSRGAEHSAEKKNRTLVKVGQLGDKDNQASRVQSTEGKSQTLTSPKTGGVSGAHTGLYATRKVGHIGNSDSQANRVYSPEGKSVTLSANGGGLGAKTGLQSVGCIRKLDPIECERLQGLPDTYTQAVSNTQRYKCLGNAFNVDVIVFLLSFLPKE